MLETRSGQHALAVGSGRLGRTNDAASEAVDGVVRGPVPAKVLLVKSS